MRIAIAPSISSSQRVDNLANTGYYDHAGTGCLDLQPALSDDLLGIRIMAPSGKRVPSDQVTLANIAERCGVSTWTASQALRGGNGQVNEQTRLRIVAAAHEMGYDPLRNQAARRMALQRNGSRARNHCIGFLMPPGMAHTTYMGRMLDGIMDAMTEKSYGLHLVNFTSLDRPLPKVCTSGEIDGLMFGLASVWHNNLAKLLRAEPNFADRPIVGLVDPIVGASSVHPDDFQAAYLAASYLLELGHRHVVHSFDTTWPTMSGFKASRDSVQVRRLKGIHEAYMDFGLDADKYAHVIDVPLLDCFGSEIGPQFIKMLKEHPEITAIMAPNDDAAVRIWSSLRKSDFRIPEDISLISFDDTDPIMNDQGDNILTTVRLPLYQVGQEGARLMLRSVNGEVNGLQNTILPVELIVRSSTAPPTR